MFRLKQCQFAIKMEVRQLTLELFWLLESGISLRKYLVMTMFYGGEMDRLMREFFLKKFKISAEREKESKSEYFRLHSDFIYNHH